MSSAKVSIIVPAYNVENYLATCLDSLIRQTYSKVEIVIINDGSTDNTHSIIRTYASKYQNIIVINQNNQGLSEARNAGIMKASGEYICFVDSDDWIANNTIQKAFEFLDKKTDVVLWGYIKEFPGFSMCQPLCREVERYSKQNILSLLQRIVGPVDYQLKHPELVDSYITAWGKLYKASIIKEHEIKFVSTKEIGTEDLLFNVQYFFWVKNAIILPDCLNHYRKNNSTSLTSNYKPQLFSQWKSLQNFVYQNIKGNALLEEAFYNRIACTMIGLGLNEASAKFSYKQHKENILEILNDSCYKTAFRRLKYSRLPIYWKIFFLACRYRLFFLYWFLIHVIVRIIHR